HACGISQPPLPQFEQRDARDSCYLRLRDVCASCSVDCPVEIVPGFRAAEERFRDSLMAERQRLQPRGGVLREVAAVRNTEQALGELRDLGELPVEPRPEQARE